MDLELTGTADERAAALEDLASPLVVALDDDAGAQAAAAPVAQQPPVVDGQQPRPLVDGQALPQPRSASSSEFTVEKAADLRDIRRSASQPTLRGKTSPVTRLQIDVKPAPASTQHAVTATAAAAAAVEAVEVPQTAAAVAAVVPQPPCTPRGSRAKGEPTLPSARSRAMVFDFDLTLIPRHTGGMPAPDQALAPGRYLRDLRAHLADLVRADFDLFIVTRGDVRMVRAALSRCRDAADPGCGLASWFRGMYGADEAGGAPPITRRADSFTEEDMRRIQSVAPPELWARLSLGRAQVAVPRITPPPEADLAQEQLYSAAAGGSTDGRALVGRENAALA
jgi:hypothetical protein|eukprot:COSAG06_NODE_135_length_22418_cov_9.162104_21_plen_338_part_00